LTSRAAQRRTPGDRALVADLLVMRGEVVNPWRTTILVRPRTVSRQQRNRGIAESRCAPETPTPRAKDDMGQSTKRPQSPTTFEYTTQIKVRAEFVLLESVAHLDLDKLGRARLLHDQPQQLPPLRPRDRRTGDGYRSPHGALLERGDRTEVSGVGAFDTYRARARRP
jgi:hypothetical protein